MSGTRTDSHRRRFDGYQNTFIVVRFFSFLAGIQSDSDRQLVEEQWEMVCQLNDHKETFVFGQQGCLTDTELHTTLKVRPTKPTED